MRLSKPVVRSIVLILGALMLCGVGHVLLFGVDFLECFPQFFCGVLTLIWAMSVQKRVTDPRLMRLLLLAACALLLFFLLQIARYNLFNKQPVLRIVLWYAYYVPILALAAICFYVAMYVHRPPGVKLHPAWFLITAVCALLAAAVMTNDLHQWAFRFSGGVPSEDYTYGPLFIIIYAAFGVLLLSAFIIVMHKHRRSPNREYRLLPAVAPLAMVAYLLLNVRGMVPRWYGVPFWNVGEVFAFGMVGFLESCIQTGLIPANREYERLFRLASLPAVILDREGRPVMQTAGTEYPFPSDGDREIWSQPITGGSIQWTVDTGDLRRLNEELEETNRQLEARSAYLSAENKTKEEKARLETRNRLYDGITDLLHPQLDQISALLREENFEKQLPRIAVLAAYAKRRSNMELLSADGDLPVEELVLALRESMEYVRLCGVHTAVTAAGTGVFSPALVTEAYDTVERTTEDALSSLRDMMVAVKAEGDVLSVRLLLHGTDLFLRGAPVLNRGRALLEQDGEDAALTLTFREGRGEE